MTGVRFREEWEGKCDSCATYWPLTDEFWYPRQGCRRCRACINETQARGARNHRATMTEPERLALRRAAKLRRLREWASAKRIGAAIRRAA